MMGTSKHTPGRWRVTKFADGSVGVHARVDTGGWIEIATLRRRFAADNARLIAAAPELLATLTAIHEQLVKQGINFGPLIADAEAAIAKATT